MSREEPQEKLPVDRLDEEEEEHEQEDEEHEQVGLVSVFYPKAETEAAIAHYNLLEAYQDRAAVNLDLTDRSQQIEGLFSRDFAACVAIILRSEDGAKISLAHISSIYDEANAQWLKDEVDFASNGGRSDYSIELGISKEGYEISCDKKDSSRKNPDAFVNEKIASTKEQLIKLTGKKVSVVHKLPCSMILIDSQGTVINFEGINRDQIEVCPQDIVLEPQEEINDTNSFYEDQIELPSSPKTESKIKPSTVDSSPKTQLIADSSRFLSPPPRMENKSKRKLLSDRVSEEQKEPKRHQTKEEVVNKCLGSPFS